VVQIGVDAATREPRQQASGLSVGPTGSRESYLRIALAGAGAFGVRHLDGLRNIDGVELVSATARTPRIRNDLLDHQLDVGTVSRVVQDADVL
jgi:hypothetical protein